jgi:hypothetical protein
VLKKIREYWPSDESSVISALEGIDDYGNSAEHMARVQLAIIKLSCGEQTKLSEDIELANCDHRDVLVYAEYLAQMSANHLTHFNLSAEEKVELKELKESDRAQYLNWLTRDQS